VLTFNGAVTYALERFKITWMAAIGLVVGAVWTDFLRKHVEGLFNDGTNDLPLMEEQLGYVLAVTAVCTILPAAIVNLDYAYHSRCIPVHRRVYRQRFNKLIAELQADEPYSPTHDWDYDSDGCPDAQFAYFRDMDTVKDAQSWVASRLSKIFRGKPDEPPEKTPLLAQQVRRVKTGRFIKLRAPETV